MSLYFHICFWVGLLFKSAFSKGTRSTELNYREGMGEHTALVPSFQGKQITRGNTKRCDTGILRFQAHLFQSQTPPFGGEVTRLVFSKSNEQTSRTETASFGLTSFPSFIICEMDKLFRNSCLALGKHALCALFSGFLDAEESQAH